MRDLPDHSIPRGSADGINFSKGRALVARNSDRLAIGVNQLAWFDRAWSGTDYRAASGL